MKSFSTMRLALVFIPGSLLFGPIVLRADADSEIQRLLAQPQAPAGVVLEIVSGDAGALAWALPKASRYVAQLQEKFPGLHIAIVSHGNEQFALTDRNQQKYREIHIQARNLSKSPGVELQVCGTYASWRDISAEEFPDYVDVVAAGPATINDYRILGYTHILVDKSKHR